jgi:hypothetical protein
MLAGYSDWCITSVKRTSTTPYFSQIFIILLQINLFSKSFQSGAEGIRAPDLRRAQAEVAWKRRPSLSGDLLTPRTHGLAGSAFVHGFLADAP